jgi:hypothetical protein
MRTVSRIIVCCLAALSITHAGTLAVDPTSGGPALTGGVTLGWEFQVTSTNGIVVDGLGSWDDQSDGFVLGQTFDVGLWDPSSGNLLRESVITSGSSLKTSQDSSGGWRVNPVSPIYLAPGIYRIGVFMPTIGANGIIVDPATFQAAPGITFSRFLRQVTSPSLAMPDIGPPYPGAMWFGPTFTFTSGSMPLSGTAAAPNSYLSKYGTNGLNTLLRNTNSPRAYQMQFSASALAGLPVGAKITELWFRLETNNAAFPASTVTWSDYEVTLARAANTIPGMSTTFSANMLSPVLVKSGPLSIGPNNFTSGGAPNAFCPFIVFDTPYTYQGGDLVMLFRHPGSNSAAAPPFLDSLSALTSGYGTDFRAISATSFSATTGVAASVTIVEIVFNYSINQTLTRMGTNVVIMGSGGLAGAPCHIYSSTNAALPISQWTQLGTNQFDASGGLSYTNAINPTASMQFYQISQP